MYSRRVFKSRERAMISRNALSPSAADKQHSPFTHNANAHTISVIESIVCT